MGSSWSKEDGKRMTLECCQHILDMTVVGELPDRHVVDLTKTVNDVKVNISQLMVDVGIAKKGTLQIASRSSSVVDVPNINCK